ncbi:MAG: TonB-dependent receptor [Nibricoccus sp.]
MPTISTLVATAWSVYRRYDFTQGALKNLGASLGVVWQDERLGGNSGRSATAPDPLMMPSFYHVDGGIFYRINSRMDVSLSIANLFDEKIFVAGTTGANLEIAAPRTLSLRVRYRF